MKNYINEWILKQTKNNDKITLTRLQLATIMLGMALLAVGVSGVIFNLSELNARSIIIGIVFIMIGHILNRAVPIPKTITDMST